jgi:hypothetical protein
VRNTSF